MSVSCRHLKEAKNAFDRTHPLHTFSIGIQGAPDLMAAREVAHQLGTKHHEFHFTVEEGIDAVYDLVWHLESYEQVLLLKNLRRTLHQPRDTHPGMKATMIVLTYTHFPLIQTFHIPSYRPCTSQQNSSIHLCLQTLHLILHVLHTLHTFSLCVV